MATAQQKKESATKTLNTLVFPSDLESTSWAYPEAIRFTIYERQSIDLNVVKEDVSTAISNSSGRTINKAQKPKQFGFLNEVSGSFDAVTALKEQVETSDAEKSEAQQKANPGGDPGLLGKITRGAKGIVSSIGRQLGTPTPASLSKREIRSIYLAMPQALSYNETADWSSADLGLIGAAMSGGVTEGLKGGLLDQAGTLAGGAGAALASKLLPKGAGLAATVLGSIAGSESGFSTGLEKVFDIKSNPFKEQTFQGVGFRPFSFAFNFRPRSETEVMIVRDIITSFRAYSKPNFKVKGQAGLFAYPKEFLIEFLTKENDSYRTNINLPQIKFCVLKTVETNYTGQGWASLKDGAPADISLSLTFEETEIVTQEDVFGETSVGDFKTIGGKF